MTRSSYDFSFLSAVKPCGYRDVNDKDVGEFRCIEDAKKECPYFCICDLVIKNPPEPPASDWRSPENQRLNFG